MKASSVNINIEDAERNLAVAVGYEVSCEYDAVGEMIRVNVYNVPISEFSKVSSTIYDLEEEMYPEYGCVFLVIKFSPEETERHFPLRICRKL